MTGVAAALPDPWKILHRIAWANLLLGFLLWSRVVPELIDIEVGPWRSSSGLLRLALIIDFVMGIQSVLSGGLLLRRHPKALRVSAIAGGAMYANGLFGMILTLPKILHAGSSAASEPLRTASFGAHFVQSALLMLYWTGVFLIVLGELKHQRLEEVYPSSDRPTLRTCAATAASSLAAVQILLRLSS